MQSSFDYIVIGAGSAGCVLAARLSEDPGVSVLLIEAGASDRSPLFRMPAGIRFLYNSRRYNWRYHTEPQPELNNRRIYIPRGRALGGSSSINSMIAIRGNHADYDEWAGQGLTEWSHDALLPYFKRLENASAVAAANSNQRGFEGPIVLNFGPRGNPVHEALIRSACETGLPRNDGFNQDGQIGAGYYELTIDNGRRSSATAYLRKRGGGHNLAILTGSYVSKIEIEKGRVRGVHVTRGGRTRFIEARGEVILSAGAIESPKLLMLSGIGSADELRQHGIDVRADLPEVGRNLQDHLDCSIRFEANHAVTLTPYLGLAKGGLAGLDYLLRGQGVAASHGIESGAFWGDGETSDVPTHQLHLITVLRNPPPGQKIAHGFAARICQLKPRSRGRVTLRDADPRNHPLIDPRFLTEPADLDEMIDGLSRGADIFARPDFQHEIKRILDTDAVGSRSDRERFVRSSAETIYHPSCTCRMGVDEQSVVDPSLRVRGVDGLRVVDASIMPSVIRGNTNLPVMAIAEKAADLIRGCPVEADATLSGKVGTNV